MEEEKDETLEESVDKIKIHLVKVEIPKLVTQDGAFKLGKVRIHSRNGEFDEHVANSFELEKMVGPKGFAFFELGMKPTGVAWMRPIEMQDPW